MRLQFLANMRYSGILMAGGKSLRMGQDKSQLQYQGQSFAQRGIGLLSLFCSEIIVSASQGAWPNSVRVVPDAYPGIGPMGGLHACLQACTHQCALVLPCDSPLLEKEAIAQLIESSSTGRPTVFSKNGFPEPLVGIYPKSSLPIIEKLIAQKEYSLQALLKLSSALCIEIGPTIERQFSNINTPSDFENLCQ